MVMTDNVATSYFQTEKKLSPKQVRWQDFLINFDYKLQCKPRWVNLVVDALNRKAKLAVISHAQGILVDCIKEGMTHNPQVKTILAYVNDGRMRRF